MTRSCFANMREYLAVGLAVVGVTGCTSFAVSRANIRFFRMVNALLW